MSKVIGCMGESGSGKTTAMRNLDPSTTFYIDCDGKGLSWKGWRNQYNKQAGNYAKTDNKYTVLQLLAIINGDDSMYAAALKADGKTPKTIPKDTKEKATKFKTVVIDHATCIPPEFLIPQDPKIDKKAIKAAIDRGDDIKFAHLEQGESLIIR